MALLTIAMMIWLRIASPTAPPFPNNSSNGEKIANAIATPPAPVPEWLSFLYPWQTLLSADLALIAALLGAWAIMAQVRGSLDAVHTQIRAAREDEQTRLTHEREAQAEQAREQQRRIAGAIAAGLASWMNRFGQCQLLQRYRIAIQQHGPVEILPIYAVNRFSVFDSVCEMLGEFEPLYQSISLVVMVRYPRCSIFFATCAPCNPCPHSILLKLRRMKSARDESLNRIGKHTSTSRFKIS